MLKSMKRLLILDLNHGPLSNEAKALPLKNSLRRTTAFNHNEDFKIDIEAGTNAIRNKTFISAISVYFYDGYLNNFHKYTAGIPLSVCLFLRFSRLLYLSSA